MRLGSARSIPWAPSSSSPSPLGPSGWPAILSVVRVYRGGMTLLDYDRYCSEILAQTGLLESRIKGADLTAPVLSCPGWNAGQLLRHLGGAQRWAEQVVRTRAAQPLQEEFLDLSQYVREDPGVVGPWLDEGAVRLADALRDAGPEMPLWTPVPGGNSGFYARRFTHETANHRADATLALGAEYTLDPEVAVDGIDEWMRLGSLPMHFDVHPRMRELPGPGRPLPRSPVWLA